MSFVDIFIIVVIGITALFGLMRGALKTVVSFAVWVLSFVIAFFLANAVAVALLDVPGIASIVCGQSGSLFSVIRNIPQGIGGIFKGVFSAAAKNSSVLSGAVSELDAAYLLAAYAIFATIVGVLLFVLIRVLAAVIVLLFGKLGKKSKTLKSTSRIIGFIVGGLKGTCYVIMVLVLVSAVSTLPLIGGFVRDIIHGKPAVEASEGVKAKAGMPRSVIGEPLFEAASGINVGMLIGSNTKNIDKTLDKLITKSGLLEKEEEDKDPVLAKLETAALWDRIMQDVDAYYEYG
ncbi:MAG: CvpA family protein [Firmicutes bacterium]|nr:CvpA family protein [Bacillota bacterium]